MNERRAMVVGGKGRGSISVTQVRVPHQVRPVPEPVAAACHGWVGGRE